MHTRRFPINSDAQTKKTKDWILVISIAFFTLVLALGVSFGVQRGRDTIRALIEDAFGGLLEYDLIALQGINSISVRNLRFNTNAVTSVAKINDARIRFRPIALLRGDSQRALREIEFDSVTVSFNDASINSIDDLFTELSKVAQQFVVPPQQGRADNLFFANHVRANDITISFNSGIGTWNFVLQDLLLSAGKDAEVSVETTILFSLKRRGRELAHGESLLTLTGSSDLQEFQSEFALRELGIAGIQLRSQFLKISRFGSLYRVSQADPDSRELQINGEMNSAQENWHLRVSTQELSAEGFFIDTAEPVLAGSASLQQFSLMPTVFENLGTAFTINSQIRVGGSFDMFSYVGALRLDAQQGDTIFSELRFTGDEQSLNLERLHIQQSPRNYATFSGTFALTDNTIDGTLDVQEFSLLSGRYVVDGRIAIRDAEELYRFSSRNLKVNDFLIPSLTLISNPGNALRESTANIRFSNGQSLAIRSLPDSSTLEYLLAIENLQGKTVLEALEKLFPGERIADFTKVQPASIVEESVISLQGRLDFREGFSYLPTIDADVEWELPNDMKVALDFRYADNSLQLRTLGLTFFGVTIRGSSSIALSQRRQSISGEFTLGQKSYALEGAFRNNYTIARLSDQQNDTPVVNFEYSAEKANSVALFLQAQDFLVPVSRTQIPRINCNIRYNQEASYWELSIVDFLFEDSSNDLKFEFSGYLNSETGLFNDAEYQGSRLRDSQDYSPGSELSGVLAQAGRSF